jgi:regulator of protease activity HflC (stomatin/prohibitin superfamily)
MTKTKIFAIFIAVLAIITVACIGKIGEDVKNETIVVNQFPFTGKMEYWTTPGYKWQWFGKTTTYDKAFDVYFGAKDEAGQVLGEPIDITFNDASEGAIRGSLRVSIPTDPFYLSKIQQKYPGMENVTQSLLRQNLVKVIYASGPLMSAFESYAEKKNDLIEYITDQLNYGIYKTTVKTVEIIDQTTGENKIVKIASRIPDPNSPGGFVRSEEAPLPAYGFNIGGEYGQIAISKIDYSETVKQQIAQQQEANMMIQTSKAKTLAAQQEAIRAEEAGKAAAMQAKWEQEKAKAVAVTKAEQEFEVARLAALKANEEAKKIKAEGEAEAYRQRKLVEAGLSPKERAEFEMKTKIGIAEAFAQTQWPSVVMMGGNGQSANPMDVIALERMVELTNKMSE